MRILSEFGASTLERSILVAAVLFLVLGASAAAQDTGRIVGTVTEAANGGAVAGAQVIVEGTGIGAVSGQRGTYSLPNVPAGSRTIVVTMLGFETVREQVDVASGSTVTVDVALPAGFVEMGAITVIGASRRPTRIVEAPAAVSVVTPEEVQREAAHGQLPRLFKNQPGIDVVQSGVQDFNINARGFNSSLNRRVLVLQDGIDRSLGFLQSQEWSALSMPLDDLGKLELVRGPGSALYGANAFSGVLNISTPAPADIVGTKIATSGGERGTGRFDIRHAGETSDGAVGLQGERRLRAGRRHVVRVPHAGSGGRHVRSDRPRLQLRGRRADPRASARRNGGDPRRPGELPLRERAARLQLRQRIDLDRRGR